MGGYGSGRRPWVFQYRVEDALKLDIGFLRREGWRPGGTIIWSIHEKPIASIRYRLHIEQGYIQLFYRWRETESIDYEIDLIRKHPFFGGLQFYFQCPSCGRRAMKLYKSPGSKYFECRACQHLTYQSCRESHKYDKMFARLAGKSGLPVWAFKDAFKD